MGSDTSDQSADSGVRWRMGVRIAEAPELEKVMDCHREVADTVRRKLKLSEGITQEEINRWGAVLAVFARSGRYARAATFLLSKGHWEAAGVIARAVWEDAAVLAYIQSRKKSAEDFAELYLKYVMLERWRVWQRYEKHGATPTVNANLTEDDIDKQKDEFCAFREQLWQGKRDGSGKPCFQSKSTWNGLTIKLTFDEADLGNFYDDSYRRPCLLIHPSPLALEYAFQGELRLGGTVAVAHERKQALLIVHQLMIAVGIQIEAAEALIGVTPKGGMPDLKALMQEAVSAD